MTGAPETGLHEAARHVAGDLVSTIAALVGLVIFWLVVAGVVNGIIWVASRWTPKDDAEAEEAP